MKETRRQKIEKWFKTQQAIAQGAIDRHKVEDEQYQEMTCGEANFGAHQYHKGRLEGMIAMMEKIREVL